MRGSNSTYQILQLQNKIKRDPSLYYEEFIAQYEFYQSLLKLYMMTPQNYNENLADLVMFLAQVSSCYKEELKNYHLELMNTLKTHYSLMDAGMRMLICKALILMRNRGRIDAEELIPLFFLLLRAKDKVLRKYLQTHIIADIKNMNIKHKNMKVNSALQNLMYKMLRDDYAVASKVSLDIMIELYRRHIWNDAKTVNAIATACFSKVNKILVAALQFFLGSDDDDEEKDSSDSEDDTVTTVKEVMLANKVNKKSRSRKKILKRTKQAVKKSKKKKKKEVFDFSAIHLLHDPQGMSEKLLKMLSEMNERYEIKLMVMNLISRLVGVHQLILLNFYALLLRYLKPHQRDVTRILTFAAQAAHEYVPPDAMEPVVKTIAYNFVTERNSFEVMTVGINAIKEICARCPLAISYELLHDIAEYKSYKNKNVQMAARSLIQLFRKINPQMLKRKFRNRPTEATKNLDTLEYGALKAKSYIPGTEALPIEPSAEDATSDKLENDDGNDSDCSWIDVSHSEDELNSDDDKSGEEDEDDEDGSGEDDEDNEKGSGEDDNDEEDDDAEKEQEKNKNSKDGKKNVTKNKSKENETTGKDVLDEKEKAMIVSQTRVLSQEEFKKIKAAQIAKEVQFSKGKKRKAEDEININGKEIVSIKDIEKLHKKPKPNKESRLETVLEGREGREKFGKRRKKKNFYSSKTKKEQTKNKAFMMVKHKVRAKQKRSFKDKQITLRNALLKKRRRN